MTINNLTENEQISYNIGFANFLNAYEIEVTDISAVDIWIKTAKGQPPIVTKSLNNGLTFDGDKLKLSFFSSDYGDGKLEGGKSYPYFMEVFWNGNTSNKEYPMGKIKVARNEVN